MKKININNTDNNNRPVRGEKNFMRKISCHVVTETEESYSGNLQHSQHT